MQLESPASRSSDLIDLPDLVRTLSRYKWLIAATTLTALVLALAYVFTVKPTYRATSTILIEAKSSRPISTQLDTYDPGAGTLEYYATQHKVLESRTVAERTVDQLKLVDEAEFAGAVATPSGPLAWLKSLLPGNAKAGTEAERATLNRERVIEDYYKRLKIIPKLGTQLVDINFDARSAELSARVANEVGRQYIESSLQSRLDITKQSANWLAGKLGELRQQLETSEKALQNFRQKQNLVAVGGARNLLQEQAVDNAKQLRDVQNKATELANAYATVKAAGNDATQLEGVSALLLDPVVQKASASYVDAQEAYRQVQRRYGPKHPNMEVARGRLEASREAYYSGLRQAAQGVKAQYEIAAENARVLSQQVEKNQTRLLALDSKTYELSALERTALSNRELYDSFLKQFKQTDETQGFESVAARIIDVAVPPVHPYSPRKKRVVLIALACGLLLGIFIAIFKHLLSEEIRSVEDLEEITQLPVLGVVPLLPGAGALSAPARTFLEQPQAPFSEGVRSVQTAIQIPDAAQKLRRLMITSSIAGEGKTTLAVCLAMGFGASTKVLLVEADLRRPSMASVLGLAPGRPGLMQLLGGQAKLDDCLQPMENSLVRVLPAGGLAGNPAEALGSEAFAALMRQLAQDFDQIIIDCPPCQAGADALILSRYAQGVVMVVKSQTTTRRVVKHAVKRLRLLNAPLLGTVITQLDLRKHSSDYDGYYYAYDSKV